MTISSVTDATLTQMDWETSSRDRCSLLSRCKMFSWALTAARWRINAAEAAEKEAATRRATDAQVLEDAERLIAAWNRPRSPPPSGRATGFYGYAARPVRQSMPSICVRWIVTPTRL
jgi:hypothetical protein